LRRALVSEVSSSGSSTFRSAVIAGRRLYIWKTNPTWRARHAVSFPSERLEIVTPSTAIVPEVGRSSPPIRFRRVDFPDPDGPIRARNSPWATVRASPSRTSIFSPPR
jgi:hypothetical protein